MRHFFDEDPSFVVVPNPLRGREPGATPGDGHKKIGSFPHPKFDVLDQLPGLISVRQVDREALARYR